MPPAESLREGGARGAAGPRAARRRGPRRRAGREPARPPRGAARARRRSCARSRDAGHRAWARWSRRTLEAVKVAHAERRRAASSSTPARSSICRAAERRAALEQLGDAARLAAKLRLEVGLGGGLGFRTLREVLEAAPAVGARRGRVAPRSRARAAGRARPRGATCASWCAGALARVSEPARERSP